MESGDERRKSTKLPYMQFYPADWLQDTQVLTLEAQGAWIKLLCALWTAAERGVVRWGYREFEAFWGRTRDEAEMLIDDLSNVADISLRNDDGNIVSSHEDAVEVTVICRRMVREERVRKQTLARVKRHRNADDTRVKRRIYQKSEVRSQKSEEDKDSPKGSLVSRTENQVDGIWKAWPPIKRKSKGGLRKALKRLNPSPELFESMLTKIELLKKSSSWRKDNGQFIPYPATWVNDEGWEDEIDDFFGLPNRKKMPD